MESMDNFRERFEALEQQTEHLKHQTQALEAHTPAVERQRRWWLITWRIAVVIALGLALVRPHLVQAKTFHCGAGDVQCLIDAINEANANGKKNTIWLEVGPYTLTAVDNVTGFVANGLPVITSTLTITGAGAETTRIERDASAPDFRLVHVAVAGTLTLRKLTIRGGRAGAGAGIRNEGTLTLTHTTIASNGGNAEGAAIRNEGTLTLTHTTIANNSGFEGGGISNASGIARITHSTVAHNNAIGGGGLVIHGGTVIITQTTFTGNTANLGAGLLNATGGMVSITGSIIMDNNGFSSPGIHNAGMMTLTNTTIANNHGGDVGGGITNGGTLTLTNCTLSGNSVAPFGSGGGLNNGGTVALENTIIARNIGTRSPDCFGLVPSLGTNLIGDPTGCTITLQPSDLTGDPGLATFRDNGRPGNGHFPLLPTSRAINAGNDAACPPTDQLGEPRVGRCDIGAIEFQPTNRCPLGQGFWKTHTGAWPVTTLTLGSQSYTQAELLTLFDTPPGGDASLILADQLIAAKLNLANGTDPTPISATITNADSLLSQFGSNRLPYSVPTSSAIGQQMVNDANVLDRYNNGDLTPDCQP